MKNCPYDTELLFFPTDDAVRTAFIPLALNTAKAMIQKPGKASPFSVRWIGRNSDVCFIKTNKEQQKQGVKPLLPSNMQFSNGCRTAHQAKCVSDRNWKKCQILIRHSGQHTLPIQKDDVKPAHNKGLPLPACLSTPYVPCLPVPGTFEDIFHIVVITGIRRPHYISLKEFLLALFLFTEVRIYFRPLLFTVFKSLHLFTPSFLSLLPEDSSRHGSHTLP